MHTPDFDTKTGVVHMPPGRVVHMVFDVKLARGGMTMGRAKSYAPPPRTRGGGAYGFRRGPGVVHMAFGAAGTPNSAPGVFYKTSNCL